MANMHTALPLPPREELAARYNSGMSQVEVAATYGATQKVVHSWMRKLEIPARIAKKRDQAGEKNSSGSLMGWGMTSSGRYSTQKITAYPRTENASTLSEILEEHPDPKYFLPPDRVTRIRQSASQQKPQLLEHSPVAGTQAGTTPA